MSVTQNKRPCSREEKAVQSHSPWGYMDLHRGRDRRPTVSGTAWTYSVRDHTVSGTQGPVVPRAVYILTATAEQHLQPKSRW